MTPRPQFHVSPFTHHASRPLSQLTYLTFLTFLTLPTSAATVVGNLTDISLAPLDTMLMFAPTNTVLVSGSGLSAGPPKVIGTADGAFSVVLDAGDYTVSLPLIPWRNPFLISVMDTTATLNITNAMTTPVTYTYTNRLTIEVRDSTNMLAAAFNQSINTLRLPHLQKALNDPAHKLKLMWFGDSTGADSIAAVQGFLNDNYVWGTEPILMLSGSLSYFDLPAG